MTRDEAIEAGARALWDGVRNELADPYPWGSISDVEQGRWRRRAAAVLDAVGWVEPDCDHVWERELSSEWATCVRCGANVRWPDGGSDTPDGYRLANTADR